MNEKSHKTSYLMLQWRHLLWLANFHAYENEAKNMTRREILVQNKSQYTQLMGKGGRSVGSSHGGDEGRKKPKQGQSGDVLEGPNKGMATFMRQEQIARTFEEEEYRVGTAPTYPSFSPHPS